MIDPADEHEHREVLAELFRELREKNGFTRSQLAKRIRPRFQYHHQRTVEQLVGMIRRIERASARVTVAPVCFMIAGMNEDPAGLTAEIEARRAAKRRERGSRG